MSRKKKTITEVIEKCLAELTSDSKGKASKKAGKKANKKTSKKPIKNIPNKNGKKVTESNSPIISSLIKSIIENNAKNSKKKVKESKEDDSKEYVIVDEEKDKGISRGYGTVSNSYAISPKVEYVNYDKIFSHLGNFKSKGMYENPDLFNVSGIGTESTREMVNMEVIDKAARHFKYFVVGEVNGRIDFTPPTGMGVSSKDWEKYRLMSQMSIYLPLIKLKGTIV